MVFPVSVNSRQRDRTGSSDERKKSKNSKQGIDILLVCMGEIVVEYNWLADFVVYL